MNYAVKMMVQDIEEAYRDFKALPIASKVEESAGLVALVLFILLLCFL